MILDNQYNYNSVCIYSQKVNSELDRMGQYGAR
jgi:hypothetical protein